MNFSVSVEKVEANHYTVTLQVDFEKVDEYMASVSISGYCEISDDTANLKELLRVNAPAILFPYARAQLSMLTAQPETEPIVLPVVDFQRMYEQSQKKGNI